MSGQPQENEGKEMQYWEVTAEMFSDLFKKPPMAEKYLTKPPFKYLFDIVMATAKETGFPNNLYSAEELNPDIYKDKDTKMRFLNKLIDLVNLCIGDKLEVKANKIVAGLEPENTNILLQALYQIATSHKSFDEYITEIVSKYSGGSSEPSDKNKKKDKEDAKNEEEKKHKISEDKKDKHKKDEDAKAIEEKRIEKQKSPEGKESKKEGKPKPEKKIEQREQVNKEEEEPVKKQKNDMKHKPGQKGDKDKKPIDKGVEIEKVKRKDKSDENKGKEGERPMTPPKGGKGKVDKKEEKANQKPEKMNEPETMPNPNKKPTKVEDIDPTKHGGLVRGAMEDIKKVTESEESHTQAQNEDPGASKIHMGHIKTKAAKTDAKAPEIAIKKTNVEGGEAEFLKQAIQSLTQLTMPLGKSIDFINEDLDTMSKEYENWRKQALEGYSKMEDLQKESELSLQPLQDKLAEIEEQIKDQYTKIVNIKTQIFKNELNIQSMISTLVGKG